MLQNKRPNGRVAGVYGCISRPHVLHYRILAEKHQVIEM